MRYKNIKSEHTHPMRILFTNNHLSRFGGSETWTLTMAREAIRRGFDVGVYTKHKGVVSNLLKDYLDDDPQDYDLAIINHNTCTNVKAKKKIFTCHGLFEPLEVPPPGMDIYVAVSENIQKKFDIPHLIKNGIDTELFKPIKEINDTPENILAITEVPVPFQVIRPTRLEETMPYLMNKADLVITIGRGVLEAMSCGRNVIVYDNRPYLGYRADGYLKLPIYGNVGGPYLLTELDLKEELKKYNKEDGAKNREYILKHHDIKKTFDQYLNL